MLPCYLKSGRRPLPLPVTDNSATWYNAARVAVMQDVNETKLVGIELAALW